MCYWNGNKSAQDLADRFVCQKWFRTERIKTEESPYRLNFKYGYFAV